MAIDTAQRLGEAQSLTYRSGKQSTSAERSTDAAGLTALEFLTDLSHDLSRGPVDLPCFPNVVIKIRDALNNPKMSAEEVVTLVGAEPRLAAKLIQTANSVAFNPSGKRVTELRTAITRLGQQLVQGTAMAFAVQQMKNEPKLRGISESLSELWKESITVAAIAQVVARRTKVKSDEAFLAGLLHGIGRLYVMVHGAANPAIAEDPQSQELIASWHPSIGKAVLENWQIDEAISEAVGEQTAYDRRPKPDADLTDILIASVILAELVKRSEPRTVEELELASFRVIGLNAETCAATLKHTEYQLGSLQDALGC